MSGSPRRFGDEVPGPTTSASSAGPRNAAVADMLNELLRRTHLGGPSELPAVVAESARRIGARNVVLYLIDYAQRLLVPVTGPQDQDGAPLSVAPGSPSSHRPSTRTRQMSAGPGPGIAANHCAPSRSAHRKTPSHIDRLAGAGSRRASAPGACSSSRGGRALEFGRATRPANVGHAGWTPTTELAQINQFVEGANLRALHVRESTKRPWEAKPRTPSCCSAGCRRRDSNPRHADYVSRLIWLSHRKFEDGWTRRWTQAHSRTHTIPRVRGAPGGLSSHKLRGPGSPTRWRDAPASNASS